MILALEIETDDFKGHVGPFPTDEAAWSWVEEFAGHQVGNVVAIYTPDEATQRRDDAREAASNADQ